MIYREAVQFLSGFRRFGLRPGLESTRQLAALAGDPHRRLRFIHVAGTNGKGSTCAMLESIYRAAGLRVGLFTSPHLVSFRERIQINRRLIDEADVARRVEELKGHIEARWNRAAVDFPTFFEVVTVLALRHFEEQGCDLVIWETGMGGRLDATNIVTPLAGVITNIGFDHQQWLGSTIAEIAREKAGIIKPGVPVLTAAEQPEALEVIARTAASLGSPLTIVNSVRPFQGSDVSVQSALAGDHQRINAALAAATARCLGNRIAVDDGRIRRGLESVSWPGRLQRVRTEAGNTVLIDGAHNVPGAIALRTALETLCSGVRVTLILGTLKDKDWPGICGVLAPIASRLFLVPVQSERTGAPEDLLSACRQAASPEETCVCPSLADALARASGDPCVVIAGSLYLAGEALERLGVMESPDTEERGLNESNPDDRQP